jgi:hypothetical protein
MNTQRKMKETLTPPSTPFMALTVNFAMKSLEGRSPVLIHRDVIATKRSAACCAAHYSRADNDMQEKILLLAGIQLTGGEILICDSQPQRR